LVSSFGSDLLASATSEAHAPGFTPDDVRFMRRALALAEQGAGQVAPNPKVGAVIVRDGAIVGEGFHAHYGEAHAEVHALRIAGELARGATAYVSLEPCNHVGKTPPCTDALIGAGITRVVYATRDPNATAAGGAERLAAAGVIIQGGLLEAEARLRNAPFFHAARGADIPFVTLKLATSIDGAIVDATRKPGWITGPDALNAVHHLRAEADAIGVGIGTALADDPLLTVRLAPAPRVTPRRVIFDRRARLPLGSHLVRTAREIPVTVVTDGSQPTREAALAERGIQVLVAPLVREAFRALRDQGVRHLLVEGGSVIASDLLDAGLVHHLVIFQAPVILGTGAVPAFAAYPSQGAAMAPRLRVLERRVFGDDLMTRYAVSGD
jgi:diaminohydroxyphosphoribosylaminopyrimidine deaminase / 5-amino-6-(5-phosphoribosylamino)uracil reductase